MRSTYFVIGHNISSNWKNTYSAEQLIVAASTVNKNLSKVKWFSKGHLLPHLHVTLEIFLSAT